jgi:hypothetical protein
VELDEGMRDRSTDQESGVTALGMPAWDDDSALEEEIAQRGIQDGFFTER